MLVLAEHELGRLRQGEESDADDEAGGGADHGEDSPAGPVQLVGDDGPGQAGHGDVPDHPEGGEDTEGPASLGAGLELSEVGPDERNTAAYSGDQLHHPSSLHPLHSPESADEPEGQEGWVVLADAGHGPRHGVHHHGHDESVPPAVNIS